LSSTIRIPSDIYRTLQDIQLSLESHHYSAAPSLQNLVNIALQRLIRDWNNPDEQSLILEELLRHRKASRSRMGKPTKEEN
jgi:hypothetical protein